MNPKAVWVYILGGSVGYVADQLHGCSIGLVVASGVVLVLSIVVWITK